MPSIRDTIMQVAQEEGIDPAYALAVAERESRLNPNAGGTGSIKGLYQMTGANRRKYGQADDADAEDQVRAFARFTHDLRGEMHSILGREPTGQETYLGHYWGGPRAARVLSGAHAGLSPTDLFSPRELAGNPDLAKGSTAGGLASTIMADVDRRAGRYIGSDTGAGDAPRSGAIDFAQYGQPKEEVDFSQFGQAEKTSDGGAGAPAMSQSPASNDAANRDTRPGTEIDLTQYGLPAPPPQAPAQTGMGM